MRYLQTLGQQIGAAWAATGGALEALPDVAAEALRALPPPADLPEQVAKLLLGVDRALPSQHAPVGAFGQPGVTCFRGDRFIIDLYFWNNAFPAVHNHPFCGCFCLLRGRSLHNVYRFGDVTEIEPRLHIGELHAEAPAVVEPGEIVPFSLERYPLIHSLVHLPNPSVSLVVRSIQTEAYFRYFPPSLALAMDIDDDRVGRQLALLAWMRKSGSPAYRDHLLSLLATADLATAVRVVSAVYDPAINAELIAVIARRHARLAELLLPALERSMRQQLDNEYREQFADEDTRSVLSALMCADDRRTALRLLRELYPTERADALLPRLSLMDDAPADVREDLGALARGEPTTHPWQETVFRALTR